MQHDCLVLWDCLQCLRQVPQVVIHLAQLVVHVPLVDLCVALRHGRLSDFSEELCLAFKPIEHLPHDLFHIVELACMLCKELLNAHLQLLKVCDSGG